MGNKLFGVNISGLITQHVAPGLLPMRLIKWTEGPRPTPTSAPSKLPVEHFGRGIWEDVDPDLVDGVKVLLTDRVALIIGDSLKPAAVPEPEDLVAIENISLPIVRLLSRDPAAATYKVLCRARKPGG